MMKTLIILVIGLSQVKMKKYMIETKDVVGGFSKDRTNNNEGMYLL